MQKFLASGALSALFLAGAALAGETGEVVMDQKMVVALTTPHFEIAETDISHLAVGESETIVTGHGRTVDLLRTEDGVEVFLDGVKLDIPMEGEEHVIREEIEIHCDSDEDCESLTWISEDGEIDLEALQADGAHKVIVVRKETEVVGGDVNVEVEVDENGAAPGEKVIIIRKKSADEI
jgi:hypothetical protein